ncbi:dephospho-CoA kinase-domain-containing protein [Zopfochytrium polystomum]|nr:dephospho-CoA kinase-domain-containing protein [Zopfochytrium polystomum]
MRIIGLTGGIATGKSTVSETLKDHDIAVVDADLIARDVMEDGHPARRRLLKALGPRITSEIVKADTNELDRGALGALVFRDRSIRTKVNEATHPYIKLEMLRQLLWAFICFRRVVVLDTPLLIEVGMDKWVHSVCVVYVPESIQRQRLMDRDHITADKAQEKIDAQIPIERKRQLANLVIDNTAGIRDTRRKVQELLPKLKSSWLSTAIAWSLLSVPATALYSLLTVVKVLKL